MSGKENWRQFRFVQACVLLIRKGEDFSSKKRRTWKNVVDNKRYKKGCQSTIHNHQSLEIWWIIFQNSTSSFFPSLIIWFGTTIFSIFIRISHSTWEEKQHLAKQHLLLRKRLLAAFRDTYVKKWKTLVKTSSLFSRVKIRRIFTLKRDFYCDARLENIQKVSKRAKIWQFMTFLENVW